MGPQAHLHCLTLFVCEWTVSQLYYVKNLSTPKRPTLFSKDPSYVHFTNRKTEASE